MYENDTTTFFDPSKQVSDAKFFIHFSMNEREQCGMINKWYDYMKQEFMIKDH